MKGLILLSAWPAIRLLIILAVAVALGNYLKIVTEQKPVEKAKKSKKSKKKTRRASPETNQEIIDLRGVRNKIMRQTIRDLAEKNGLKVRE